MEVSKQFHIDTLILDVDGVLTDGKVYLCQHNEETPEYLKAFDTKDGRGIMEITKNYDVQIFLLTAESSGFPHLRARKLGIEKVGVCNSTNSKLSIMKEWMGGNLSTVCYVGDDEMDIPCLKECGYAACPKDAHEHVIQAVTNRDHSGLVCTKKGGRGAVREVIDTLIEAKHLKPKKL